MTEPGVDDLTALRHQDAADVYKGERLAGRLVRDVGDTLFRYDTSYLDDQDAPPVALSLPKQEAAFRTAGESVPPFFAGLLPEGARLTAVVSNTKTSLDDHLTLLLAVGQDTIGDVRVVPVGVPPANPATTIAEHDVAGSDLLEVFAAATSSSPSAFERIALPGVQAKVSAAMLSAPVGTARLGPAILKLTPPTGYDRLVENEHFFLRMARGCGIPTPPTQLVHDRTGRSGLLVSRFDRVLDGERLRRLAQEDACQLLDRYPAAKYRLKVEDVAVALARAVVAGGGSRLQALRRVLELVAFNYVIGNGDLQGKNFSARSNPDGIWEVTPAYDIVCTQPYAGFRDPMALTLYGRANRLDRRDLVDSFTRLGLRPQAIEVSLDRLAALAPPWVARLAETGFSSSITDRLAEMMEIRIEQIAPGSARA